MSMWLIAGIVLVPLGMVCIDTVAGLRTRGRGHRSYEFGSQLNYDFTILVPIYGHIKYLENADHLSQYGNRVVLCTTGGETAGFYQALSEIADKFGFRVFRAPWSAAQNVNKRATSGTTRDRLIRDALVHVTTEYVIPLDADSTTMRPIAVATGALEKADADIASVRLVPRNTKRLLGRFQRLEYQLSMGFRFAVPWLVSGACHIARTAALRNIMQRHSLFFQGNDVETGLLAKRLGYKVIHLPFEVYTTVPDRFKPWLRQRLAWAGGEFRLFMVNVRFAVHHPFFWFYGGIVAIAAFPLRWLALVSLGWTLAVAGVLYLILSVYLHLRSKSALLLLMPLYTLFSSLLLTPIGVFWYFWMVYKDKNWGVIKPSRSVAVTPA